MLFLNMQYAALLGYSCYEIFEEQSLEALAEPLGEERVRALGETTTQQCRSRGKAVLSGGIGDLVGTTGSCLKQYPRAKKLLSALKSNGNTRPRVSIPCVKQVSLYRSKRRSDDGKLAGSQMSHAMSAIS